MMMMRMMVVLDNDGYDDYDKKNDLKKDPLQIANKEKVINFIQENFLKVLLTFKVPMLDVIVYFSQVVNKIF